MPRSEGLTINFIQLRMLCVRVVNSCHCQRSLTVQQGYLPVRLFHVPCANAQCTPGMVVHCFDHDHQIICHGHGDLSSAVRSQVGETCRVVINPPELRLVRFINPLFQSKAWNDVVMRSMALHQLRMSVRAAHCALGYLLDGLGEYGLGLFLPCLFCHEFHSPQRSLSPGWRWWEQLRQLDCRRHVVSVEEGALQSITHYGHPG